jgi:tRNA(Ile)-lysidine synthase
VLHYIRKHNLMRAGDRVAVAVSGGADSVALLRVLLELRTELGVVLGVAHFNHKLRGEQSDADEAFVADLAKHHGLELWVDRRDLQDDAVSKLGVEAAGRQLRYTWFDQLAREARLDCVATAHTLDDQAETVLLKLTRGAGTRGLAGIYPVLRRKEEHGSHYRIVRPLLAVTRDEVEAYLTPLEQTWREDESNLDRRFLRNRVRHELLPMLERDYNPNIREALTELAEVSRAEDEYWDALVTQALTARISGAELTLEDFKGLPVALQRRIVKCFAERQRPALDFEHIEKLRLCAVGELRQVALPGGRFAIVKDDGLKICAEQTLTSADYEYWLPIPGEVHVPELSATVRALLVTEEFARESSDGSLLAADLVGTQLRLRNWKHGDRYRPAHRGSEEKLKRLFAEAKVPADERPAWPVALCGDDIVWVQALPVAADYQWKATGAAVKIEVIK